MVLESGSGRIAYLVMDFGEVLGLGGKLLHLSCKDFTMGAGGRYGRQTLQIDYTREQLEALEGFDEDHWPQTPYDSPYHAVGGAAGPFGLLYRASEMIGKEVISGWSAGPRHSAGHRPG